jgi:hypothetical protein
MTATTMQPKLAVLLVALLVAIAGCSTKPKPRVDFTKTVQGFYEQTDPNHVSIVRTRPPGTIVELGTLTADGFLPLEEAKMHNMIRTRAAALGATSVFITEQGILPPDSGYGDYPTRWASGIAIRTKAE